MVPAGRAPKPLALPNQNGDPDTYGKNEEASGTGRRRHVTGVTPIKHL